MRGRHWSQDDIDRLVALWRSGMPLSSIASELQRSKNAVALKLSAMELSRRNCERWTIEQLAVLRQMCAEQRSSREIARHLGRTVGSVRRMVIRLQLTRPES